MRGRAARAAAARGAAAAGRHGGRAAARADPQARAARAPRARQAVSRTLPCGRHSGLQAQRRDRRTPFPARRHAARRGAARGFAPSTRVRRRPLRQQEHRPHAACHGAGLAAGMADLAAHLGDRSMAAPHRAAPRASRCGSAPVWCQLEHGGAATTPWPWRAGRAVQGAAAHASACPRGQSLRRGAVPGLPAAANAGLQAASRPGAPQEPSCSPALRLAPWQARGTLHSCSGRRHTRPVRTASLMALSRRIRGGPLQCNPLTALLGTHARQAVIPVCRLTETYMRPVDTSNCRTRSHTRTRTLSLQLPRWHMCDARLPMDTRRARPQSCH